MLFRSADNFYYIVNTEQLMAHGTHLYIDLATYGKCGRGRIRYSGSVKQELLNDLY